MEEVLVIFIQLFFEVGVQFFGSPGINVSASYHQRFTNAGELFINYGTPAANSTIQRVVVKYVLRFGSGSGT